MDTNGFLVAEYVYDAWGNHKVLDNNGVENVDSEFIGNVNPFRYRGYYFDTESKFYYLNSRYYYPSICRFISPDSMDYIDPSSIGGLNIYTYCGNNPVMNVDPNGNDFWSWLLLGIATIVAVAVIVVGTILSGGSFALLGSVMVGAGSGFLFGAGANIISQGLSTNWNWESMDPIEALEAGGIGAAVGAVSGFVSGYIGSIFEFSGKLFGYSLGKATIGGINVGKAFASLGGTEMITKVFAVLGKATGAFIGGAMGNEYANQWFGKNPTSEENVQESIKGIFLDNILSGIYNIF